MTPQLGRWYSSEENHHINCLELKAILLGLQSLCKEVTHDHIKVMTDNITAVTYIRNVGVVTPSHVMTLPDIYGSGVSRETNGFPLAIFQVKSMLSQTKPPGFLMFQLNGS